MSIEGVLFQRLLNEYDSKFNFLTTRSNELMTTLQDVQDKIAAEKAQVSEAVGSLKAQVKELQDKLASGEFVTSEQLDGIAAAVDGIFEAPAPVEAPVEPAPVEVAPEEPAVDPVSDPSPVAE